MLRRSLAKAMSLFSLLALAIALPATADADDSDKWGSLPGWEVFKTGQGYADLVASLEAAVAANKMGIVARASATAGAKKVLDKVIPGNMVVGVYHPRFAVPMLEASVPAGIEAPIRFYVTENEDKTATLSYKTPSTVFAPYLDGNDKLQALADELDGVFANIAKEATKM